MQYNGYSIARQLRKYSSSRELTFTFEKGWTDLRDLLNKAADKLDELEAMTDDMGETIDKMSA